MYLLSKDGRRHLLEFLRNLTPQVLLLTTTFVLFIQGAHSQNPGWLYFLAGLVACVLIMAVVANIENLLDNAISDSLTIAAERDRLRASCPPGRQRLRLLLGYIWAHHKGAFVELTLAIAVLYFGLIAVLIGALAAAQRALR